MQEIDNALEVISENGKNIYRNRMNPLQVQFPLQADEGDLVRLTHQGRTISWSIEGVTNAVSRRSSMAARSSAMRF